MLAVTISNHLSYCDLKRRCESLGIRKIHWWQPTRRLSLKRNVRTLYQPISKLWFWVKKWFYSLLILRFHCEALLALLRNYYRNNRWKRFGNNPIPCIILHSCAVSFLQCSALKSGTKLRWQNHVFSFIFFHGWMEHPFLILFRFPLYQRKTPGSVGKIWKGPCCDMIKMMILPKTYPDIRQNFGRIKIFDKIRLHAFFYKKHNDKKHRPISTKTLRNI